MKLHPVEKTLTQWEQNWFNQVSRMKGITYPEQLLEYRPIGRRRPGRPLKRLLDGYSGETETGHLLA
jgi:hypothetical protein